MTLVIVFKLQSIHWRGGWVPITSKNGPVKPIIKQESHSSPTFLCSWPNSWISRSCTKQLSYQALDCQRQGFLPQMNGLPLARPVGGPKVFLGHQLKTLMRRTHTHIHNHIHMCACMCIWTVYVSLCVPVKMYECIPQIQMFAQDKHIPKKILQYLGFTEHPFISAWTPANVRSRAECM